MSKRIHTSSDDGRLGGCCTLNVNGITVNVRYTRPYQGEDEIKNASKPFCEAFFELVSKGKTGLSEAKK